MHRSTIKKISLFTLAAIGAGGIFVLAIQERPKPRSNSAELIRNAYKMREIDYEHYLLYRIQAVYAQHKLPAAYRSRVPIPLSPEMTHLLEAIQRYWSELSPDIRKYLRWLFYRPTYDIFMDQMPAEFRELFYPVGVTVYTHTAEPFIFHYVLDGEGDHNVQHDGPPDEVPVYVLEMGETFLTAHKREVDDLQFKNPAFHCPDEDGLIDVYIHNIDGYGWVRTDCAGDTQTQHAAINYTGLVCSSFISMHNNFYDPGIAGDDGLEFMQVTAAHELFHVIQNCYNFSVAVWLKEGTAVWMEDEVFDAVNSNYNYIFHLINNPAHRLNIVDDTEDEDYNRCLGSWLFFRFLSEKYGQNVIRTLWDQFDATSGTAAATSTGNALSNTLSPLGSSTAEVLSEFYKQNAILQPRFRFWPRWTESYEEGWNYKQFILENEWGLSADEVTGMDSPGVQVTTGSIGFLGAKYIRILPSSMDQKRTYRIIVQSKTFLPFAVKAVLATGTGRKIDFPVPIRPTDSQTSGQNSDVLQEGYILVSGLGTDLNPVSDIKSAMLVFNNPQLSIDQEYFYKIDPLDGIDWQITPWGWDWGHAKPYFISPDIWVDNDQDGVPNETGQPGRFFLPEPAPGIINKLKARVRNLGSIPATEVHVRFETAPIGIGVRDFIPAATVQAVSMGDPEQPVNIHADWNLTPAWLSNHSMSGIDFDEFQHFQVRASIASHDITRHNNMARMALAHLDVVQLFKDPFRFLITNPSGENADLHFIFSIYGPWGRILVPHGFFLLDFLGFQIKGASVPFAPVSNTAAWGPIPAQIPMLPNEIKKVAIKLNTGDLENLSMAFSWLNSLPQWFNPIPPVIHIDVAAHDGQKAIGGMTLYLNIQGILSLQE